MTLSITSPDHPALDELCHALAERAGATGSTGMTDAWPAESLQLCGQAGVFRWFMPAEWGGYDWSTADQLRGYCRLASACMTTAFILTQRSGACRRMIDSSNRSLQETWLPGLATGQLMATVGISHLTTSRRHLTKPVLSAEETPHGLRLDGFSPWVTGAEHADVVVTGATLADGRQVLIALPTDARGLTIDPPAQLVALSGSYTAAVRCNGVEVPPEWLIEAPAADIMARGAAGTGGLPTSTLAAGLAAAAIDYMQQQSQRRPELLQPTEALHAEQQTLLADLVAASEGQTACSGEELRIRSNSLVLRATQAALSAAKGAGVLAAHPVGRWCREALFFLVWSCPQGVSSATLCELAGLEN